MSYNIISRVLILITALFLVTSVVFECAAGGIIWCREECVCYR